MTSGHSLGSLAGRAQYGTRLRARRGASAPRIRRAVTMPARAAGRWAQEGPMTNAPRSSKNERRDAAREKAREQRLRQQRRERRNRVVLQASIGVVIIAIVAVVAVIIVNSVRPPGPGPKNMANGGISLAGRRSHRDHDRRARRGRDADPAAHGRWREGADPGVRGLRLPDLPAVRAAVRRADQAARDERCRRDPVPPGRDPRQQLPPDNNYSTRAANAAAAVANYSPNTFYKFHTITVRDERAAEGGRRRA